MESLNLAVSLKSLDLPDETIDRVLRCTRIHRVAELFVIPEQRLIERSIPAGMVTAINLAIKPHTIGEFAEDLELLDRLVKTWAELKRKPDLPKQLLQPFPTEEVSPVTARYAQIKQWTLVGQIPPKVWP